MVVVNFKMCFSCECVVFCLDEEAEGGAGRVSAST